MLVHIVSSYIVRSHRLYLRNSLWMFTENNEATGISLIDDWNHVFPVKHSPQLYFQPLIVAIWLAVSIDQNGQMKSSSLRNTLELKLRFFETTTPAINHQPSSTTINHHQPPSTTINHHQPPSTTINHHQPLQVGHGRSQAAENKKVKGLNDVWMPPQMRSTKRNFGLLYTGNRSNGTCFDVSLRHDIYIYDIYIYTYIYIIYIDIYEVPM